MGIRLRPTTISDLAFVCAAESDSENSSFIAAWPESKHRSALHDPDIAHLIVSSTEDSDRRVGFVILAGLRNEHHSIEFKRIVITEKGCGYGRGVIREVKRLAFDDLCAHRLWLDVKDFNSRARALYEAEGFISEGILRECRKEVDGYSSLVVMSILASEI